jgi:putative ABC transport system permease protein
MRSRVLLRRRWPAALALGAVAAVGGGLVLTLATVAEDTGSAVATYIERVDAPDGMAVYCPAGTDTEQVDPEVCLRYDPQREVASLRARPDVVSVGRAAPAPVFIRPPGKEWTEAFAWVVIDDITVYGEPDVVAGRLARPGVATEVTVNEGFVRQHGLGLGDRLELTPIAWDEYNASAGLGGDPAGTPVDVEIVGVIRIPTDLTAAVEGNDALSVNESGLFLGPAWAAAAQPADFARYQNGVIVDVRPGAEVAAVLRAAEPGPVGYLSTENLVDSEVGALSDAVSYEARATWVAAVLSAIAVVVFIGQMLARQARRELDDAPALRAIGASTGMLVRSAVPRWAVSAVVAVAGATVVGAVGRTRGPVGVARRMLGAADVGLDPRLALVVLSGVAALVLGVGLGVTAAAARAPAGDRFVGRWAAIPPMPSASGMVGLAWAAPHSRRLRVQVLGVVLGLALAVGAAVASVSVVASLRHLTAEPIRYGAPWHATVSAALGPESVRTVVDSLERLDGVDAVGGLLGNDGAIGDHVVYVYGVTPVPGLPRGIEPVVSQGRLPTAPDEVALGAISLAEAGAEIGDTVEVEYREQSHPLRVVGEVLVYDNWEDLPGVGAFVDVSLIEQVDPNAPISDYVVRFEPGAVEAGVAALRAEFPRLVTAPVVPGGVRNLQRVSSWPAVLSVMIGALALATFVHGLLVMVRRQWGQLAVLRALGFRRRQLGATVTWYATAVLVPAVLIGVPLGVAAGRWGWSALADNLGVPASPVVPLAAFAAVIAIALVVVNLAAGPLTWQASRVDAARALRAE